MKKRILILLLVFSVLLVSSCSRKNEEKQTQSTSLYTYFDTVIDIYSYANESKKSFEGNCKEIEALFDHYNRLYDIYHEYSGINNLCTVNKNAGSYVDVDSEIIELLEESIKYYRITNGEMNIMLGSVLQLWKDNEPANTVLSEASKHISIDNLIIDRNNSRVMILDSLASVDVGAIAKGYATEKVAQYLMSKGISGYVINAGGNVRLIGEKPLDVDWRVGIKDPLNASEIAEVLTLHNTSCVTSGSYERKNHIIDKDTLRPATYFASVSVIAPDSSLADALSTALFCMNYEDGLDLVNSLSNVEALWISNEGKKYSTL